ncbi:CinA family protein [Rhodococcus gannanensis]|uniref:CinA family protein n=1 Tax=Rhodococcus gannanensis TaxID=1960308 RepID=A0ABW4P6D2_9NOCA
MADDVATGSAHTRLLGARLAELAGNSGVTVACAESLTSGAIASRLGAAEGSGAWFRGGVVAYSRAVKHGLLGVPDGPVVCEAAVRAMAESVSRLLDADLTVAVSGVGGPGDQDDEPPGSVWFAVHGGNRTDVERRQFGGGPEQVLENTVVHALTLLVDRAHTLTGRPRAG